MFKGTASFHHNSIISTVLEPSETIPWADFQIQRKGGAIHNKVLNREDVGFREKILFWAHFIIIPRASSISLSLFENTIKPNIVL